ncbi:MAG: hypothetical protein ACREO3_09865 [Arenimonas sp.]
MKDLRALLIDCRIEMRKSIRDFEKGELCDRINAAITDLAKQQAAPAIAAAQAEAAKVAEATQPSGKTQTANQVGLAWQTAARDLRFSHPHVYEALGQRVMNLLGQKAMTDPANEIEQLNKSVLVARKLKEMADAQRGEAYVERDAVIKERDELLGALASAVPELDDSENRLATAFARVQLLQTRAAGGGSRGGGGGGSYGGGNGMSSGMAAAPTEGPIPSLDALNAIAAGSRKFTKDQQEWALGEAMVLSGFRQTHVELLEQGESALASMILAHRKG